MTGILHTANISKFLLPVKIPENFLKITSGRGTLKKGRGTLKKGRGTASSLKSNI